MNNAFLRVQYPRLEYPIDEPSVADEIPVQETHEVYEGEIVIDADPPSYPGISVSDFLRQTTVYEDLPVPFAPRLRQGAFAGMALTLAGSLFLALLPEMQPFIASVPLLLLHGFLNAYAQWIESTPLLNYINGALLSSSLVLLIMTRNLRRGRLPLHWLACAEALGGSANLVLLLIPLCIVCVNFALWTLILIASLAHLHPRHCAAGRVVVTFTSKPRVSNCWRSAVAREISPSEPSLAIGCP